MGGDEPVDLVDEGDSVTGEATLADCLIRGLLHRAVAVMVERPGGGLVLQLRSRKDLWHPGLWTLSSTGHVRKGETYGAAAKRELKEELGVDCAVRQVSKMLMPPFTDGKLTEREWVALFVSTCDGPFTPDHVEVEEVQEMTEDAVRSMMAGSGLTPDSKILLEKYFELRK